MSVLSICIAGNLLTFGENHEEHPEIRPGEEFLGNETEDFLQQLAQDGLSARMGIMAYDRYGNEIVSDDLRPVFIITQ